MKMGRRNSASTGSRLTAVTFHYYNRRGDAEIPQLMKRLPAELQFLLQNWEEARVQTFGPMMAQRRLFCILDYQDDLDLVFVCKLLADLLEPLIIDAITMNLHVQMEKKNGATFPTVPTFESIGARNVLGGKRRHCTSRAETWQKLQRGANKILSLERGRRRLAK